MGKVNYTNLKSYQNISLIKKPFENVQINLLKDYHNALYHIIIFFGTRNTFREHLRMIAYNTCNLSKEI